MTHTKSAVFRELGLATSHASCESPAAIDSALEHARLAVQALEELRATLKPFSASGAVLKRVAGGEG